MKKNFTKFYSVLYLIPVVLIFFILTSTAIPQNKNNIKIPDGITQDQILNLKDENGSRIIPPEDPGGDAFQTRTMTGFGAGDRFGVSAKSAGDVNGDGFDDFIIGGFLNDGAGTDAGRAYLYYGGINVNTQPDVVFSGHSANEYFGAAVSTAGDINGDGYSDVAISTFGGWGDGKVYIYFGGIAMNNVEDVVLYEGASWTNYGTSISDAGDVNGDGFSDIIIGEKSYDGDRGRSFIYFGGSQMDTLADVVITGVNYSDELGQTVSGAGDVNGDGFSDVIIGAHQFQSSLKSGKAYIYFGGTSMDNLADIILTGPVNGDAFGWSVSGGKDVNGDGYSDVVVGMWGDINGRDFAYVYFGGGSMDNVPDVTFNESGSINFGSSVSMPGDVNCDGYSDVVIGGYKEGVVGKAYIYFGGANMNSAKDIELSGEGTADRFGSTLNGAGDLNNDGFADLLIGAWGYSGNTGKVYLYMYGMNGTLFSDLTMTGEATSNIFGVSVSSAGDVNGDGYSDVIVGAYGYNGNTGRAYIFYGGLSMNNIADVILTGEVANDNFGISVSSAGDVNGDGYSDVVVGAHGYSNNTGKAYIYYGGTSMNNVADVTFTGEASGDILGYSVSSAGDVNGDGFTDIIAGAPGFSGITGKVYVYYGGVSMNNIADVTMTGETTFNNFGYSVSTAQDINSDGYSDIIVGAPGYTANTGRVYIFYGGSNMNNVADVIMTGETTNDNFGFSVSSAGDVNRDGILDVVIGAYGYNSVTGKAYIFYGGSSMNNIADITMTGESANNCFGFSVSSAADVNGDGYSDVFVSAFGYLSNTGRAYIFYGGSSMNNVADVIITGEGGSNDFGRFLSSAGDVNGDSESDLIIGCPGYNSGTGKSYIYFSNFPSVHPNIVSVKDVPLDQGGYVNLKWAKSAYDQQVSGQVTNYVIERSLPPGYSGFNWVTVGTVPATNVPLYNYEARTPYDSSISANGVFFFRVTAYTNIPGEYWRSNMLSGYSRDNLAPLPPVNLAGILNVNTTQLTWNANSESDLRHYIIYRNGIQTGTSTTFLYNDNTILPDSTYTYRISAEDIHGNIGPQSNSAVITYTVSTLNIKVIPEGFYNSSSGNLNMSDTVKAYLHGSASPYVEIDSAVSVIDPVTFTGSFKFFNAPTGNYYIVIKHRNTIETWSRSGGEQFVSGTVMNYDFTSSSSQAFGNNMKQADTSPVRFAIYSGDVNQDGTIDASDLSETDNDALSSLSGYVRTDVTGDNYVDAGDVSIVDNNAYSSVSVITP